MLTRRCLLAAGLLGLGGLQMGAQTPGLAARSSTVRIGVLSLFHPRVLILSAHHPLTLQLEATALKVPADHPVTLRSSNSGFTLEGIAARPLGGSVLYLDATEFTLSVPGKLTRSYSGGLTVTKSGGVLSPVITLPLEEAVASIVAAESPPLAPPEALKAQAVASRSFLLSMPHAHGAFDSCDTTHCQFLQSLPAAGSPARLATAATQGTVLTWRRLPHDPPRIIAAMYSRSCGGSTRPLTVADRSAYPFYAVRCTFCARHPERWMRALPSRVPATEKQRISYNREHGWSALPSNVHAATADALTGRGTGHGVGLCQLGALDLAQRGRTFREILANYYPNTSLTHLP